MNGQYITELEALQVVAGDVLKENKRVRLVGEAEDFENQEEYDPKNLSRDIESLFNQFEIPVSVEADGEEKNPWGIVQDCVVKIYRCRFERTFVRPVEEVRDYVGAGSRLPQSGNVQIPGGTWAIYCYATGEITPHFNLDIVNEDNVEVGWIQFGREENLRGNAVRGCIAELVKVIRNLLVLGYV